MNRYRLSKAGIDCKSGIERLGGDKEAYERLLMRFPADEHYAQMREAIAAGDPHKTFLAAHALKGMAGNLSLARLYSAVVPLVEEVRPGESMGRAAEYEPAVVQAYSDVCCALAIEMQD